MASTHSQNHSCDPNLAIVQAYVTVCLFRAYAHLTLIFRIAIPNALCAHILLNSMAQANLDRLVIFTRKDVSTNEELCISYKGTPVGLLLFYEAYAKRQDDEELAEEKKRFLAARAKKVAKGPSKGRRRRKNKSSATAHVNSPEKASIVKDACKW